MLPLYSLASKLYSPSVVFTVRSAVPFMCIVFMLATWSGCLVVFEVNLVSLLAPPTALMVRASIWSPLTVVMFILASLSMFTLFTTISWLSLLPANTSVLYIRLSLPESVFPLSFRSLIRSFTLFSGLIMSILFSPFKVMLSMLWIYLVSNLKSPLLLLVKFRFSIFLTSPVPMVIP